MEYETVIGLEVHAHLKTRSKLFCPCPVDYDAAPNTVTCPVCAGFPGVLPVLNGRAYEYAAKIALALDCRIAPMMKFDRKAYWYPDLPKNYQISQYDLPLAQGGRVEFELDGEARAVRVRRVHLEEDAGRLQHDEKGSYVDLNRAGVSMVEIVTEPDIRSPEEAVAYLQTLRRILRYLGVADCDMEKGSMRCEPNISLRRKGDEVLGTKTEIKNLNSFKAAEAALEAELARQTGVLDSGGAVVQETMLWDEERASTRPMRSKEEAMEYRYFPEPDLPPFVRDDELIERLRGEVGELPAARKKRYMEKLELSEYDAGVLTAEKDVADYFEEVVMRGVAAKTAANWVTQDCLRAVGERKLAMKSFPARPASLAGLIRMIDRGVINNTIARNQVFPAMVERGESPEKIVEEKGLAQVTDDSAVEEAARRAVEKNPGALEDYRKGKKTAANFLFGQVMRESKGRANPRVVRKVLEKVLEELK